MNIRLSAMPAILVGVGLGLVVHSGCGSDTPTGGGPGPGDVLVIDPEAGPDRLLDAVSVDSIGVRGDSLSLRVSYSGGCEAHEFDLFAPDGFEPADPPRLPLYLRHDDHDDPCDAIVSETLVFDVTPAFALYRDVHGADGLFSMDVRAPGPGDTITAVSVVVHSGVGLTPRPEREAEEAALFLSGQLVAPTDLYDRILGDLAGIRSRYGSLRTSFSRPLGDIEFVLPWVSSRIVLRFDEEHAARVASGEYTDWDGLNASIVTEIDLRSIDQGFASLSFAGVFHPCPLSALYRGLPGVIASSPDLLSGDGPRIYPLQTENGMTYLFRDGFGDCPAGCISEEFYFFVPSGGSFLLFGPYDPKTDQIPAWWASANRNIDAYLERIACS